MQQAPSVGRVVHVWSDVDNWKDAQPAIVTRVHSEHLINATVLVDANVGGAPVVRKTSVQHASVAPEGAMRWDWPARVG